MIAKRLYLFVSIICTVALQHGCTALRLGYAHRCKSLRCSVQFRAAGFLNRKPSSLSHSLHASLRSSFDNLVYSPPKYIINTIKNQPERERWEASNVVQLTGAEIGQVESDMLELAILTGAKVEVDQSGNILYTFPMQLERILIQKWIRHRVDTAMAKIVPALAYIYRASFGLMLISSIAVVYLALMVALRSIRTVASSGGSNSSQGESHRLSRDEELFYFRIIYSIFSYDLLDAMDVFDRHANSHSSQRRLPFLAAVHSFLFGDGDPNAKHDKERLYPAAVQYIQRHHGYVIAEELALFLPKVPTTSGKDNVVVSESFVLPFLLRYGGRPVLVDDVIVNHFPDLEIMNDTSQSTSTQAASSLMKVPSPSDGAEGVVAEHELEPLLEIVPEFSRSTRPQRIGTVVLAGVNYVGVLALKSILRDHRSLQVVPSDFWRTIRWAIRWVLPLFDAYATAFVLTPAVRSLIHLRYVRIIEERNRLRRQWFNLLRTPTAELWRKLQARHQLQLQLQASSGAAKASVAAHLDQTTDDKSSDDASLVVFDSSRSINEQQWSV